MSATPFDEMTNADASVRTPYHILEEWLKEQPPQALGLMSADAEALFRRLGITFAVYGSNEGTEKLIPFDIIPRIISLLPPFCFILNFGGGFAGEK